MSLRRVQRYGTAAFDQCSRRSRQRGRVTGLPVQSLLLRICFPSRGQRRHSRAAGASARRHLTGGFALQIAARVLIGAAGYSRCNGRQKRDRRSFNRWRCRRYWILARKPLEPVTSRFCERMSLHLSSSQDLSIDAVLNCRKGLSLKVVGFAEEGEIDMRRCSVRL